MRDEYLLNIKRSCVRGRNAAGLPDTPLASSYVATCDHIENLADLALSAQPAPAGEVALPEPFAYLITDDEAPADVEALAVKIDGMLKKRADLFQIKNTMAYLQAFSGWDSSAGQFIADHGVAVSELLRRLSGAQQVVTASFPPRSA